MTVSNTTVKSLTDGDGSTVVFPIPFKYFQDSEVKVYLRDNSTDPWTQSLLTNGVEYNLTDAVGGLYTNVTMVTAPTDNSADAGEQLLIIRDVPLTQSNTLATSAAQETADRAVLISQELDEILDRCIKLKASSELSSIELPEGTDQFIKWNAGGTALEVEDIDLTTLNASIASNTANIAINAAAISSNDTDIATNAAGIATNAADILTNTSDIGNAAADIITNANAISALDVRITSLEASLSAIEASLGENGTFTLANNQSSAADITPFLFDDDDYTAIEIEYEIRRSTSTQSEHSTGNLFLVFRAYSGTWSFERGLTAFDIDGVTFTISTITGQKAQVKYTTNDLTGGSYLGILKYRIKRFEV